MSLLVDYADLISSVLGILASIALGIPAVSGVRAKRYWERSQQIVDQERGTGNAEPAHGLQRRIESMQLGGARAAFQWNAVGFTLLGLSFVFLLIATLERRAERADVDSQVEIDNRDGI